MAYHYIDKNIGSCNLDIASLVRNNEQVGPGDAPERRRKWKCLSGRRIILYEVNHVCCSFISQL